jgi:ATP-dependent Clp protease ATP-binding subunit ClpA
MFERFTESARSVVANARAAATRLHHPYIGTEHLLLALLDEASGATSGLLADAGLTTEGVTAGIARLLGTGQRPLGDNDAAALEAIGIDLDAVRARVEEVFGPGALEPPRAEPDTGLRGLLRRKPTAGGHVPFTARAKKVLELSLREALARHDNYIGSEHILLGLLRDNGGLAGKILVEADVDVDALRRRVAGSLDRAA